MKKKALRKDILKSFTHSKGRFFSILCLMALGSFALVGLRVTGPDMRMTTTDYFQSLHLADITILSDYGLDESDQDIIQQTSGIYDIEYGYLKDVTIADTQTSLRIFSAPENISQFDVVEGTLPANNNEVAISNQFRDQYALGETITFTEPEDISGDTVLVTNQFKLVGYINSGEIISSVNLGPSTTGTGDLNGYAVVLPEAFDSDIYMIARLTFSDTNNLDPYSNQYTTLVQKHKDELDSSFSNQPTARLTAIKSDYQNKINDGKQEIEKAQKEISDNNSQLEDAKTKIHDAKIEIADHESQLTNAQKKITDNETRLQKAKLELEQKESILQKQETNLSQKQAEYNQGLAQLNEQKQALEQGNADIITKQKEIDHNKSTLEEGKARYENGIIELEQTISLLDEQLANPNLTPDVQAELKTTQSRTQTILDQTNDEFNQFTEDTYEPKMATIESSQSLLNQKKQELQTGKEQITIAEATLLEAKQALDTAYQQIDDAKNQLAVATKTIARNEQTLNDGKIEIVENEKKLVDAKAEFATKNQDYHENNKKFQDEQPRAEKEIAENQQTLTDAQTTLDELKAPVYSFDTRRETPGSDGYKLYDNISTIVDSLANIFPVFLYFVAALVTITTMTRFVDEERMNSGTLKALGYSDHDIIKKFTIYGLISSLSGTIVGIILGHILLPLIVNSAYQIGFTVPKIEIHFDGIITIIALLLALISAVLPAYIVAKKSLQDKPANLLLPKPPSAGSKIWLEHIPIIWNHLSFTRKVTARNIFRYKKRMLMTIFGVCGAVTLLFTGFGMQYSIYGINQRQFDEIIHYDLIVAENDAITEKQKIELDHALHEDTIAQYSPIYYEELSKIAGTSNDKQPVKLIVPANSDNFHDYIDLTNRQTNQPLTLKNDGAIISERFAKLLNVKVGDAIVMKSSRNEDIPIKITDITEMYMSHFIFMNPEAYRNAFQQDYTSNANLITLQNAQIENVELEASQFMALEGVKGVVQNTTLIAQIDTIVQALDKIMTVLIVVATLLAVVILYNLTNINVSERIRELSTIKVLGFYNNEVTMYIYRETLILSLLGLLAGYGGGFLLHRYIITTVPPDDVMFNPSLWITTFAIPAGIVAITIILLGFLVNRRLRRVDMLEALKSVE